jgi:hypothetical protein
MASGKAGVEWLDQPGDEFSPVLDRRRAITGLMPL